MIIFETKLSTTAMILLTSASMALTVGCGKKSKFSGDSSGSSAQNAANSDGTNEIVIDESGIDTSTTGEETTATSTIDEDELIREAQVDVGIKNFLQINATFSALTGVPTTNADIAEVFSAVKLQLPSGNSIKSFSASVQVAVSKLAVTYCSVMINDDTLSSAIVPGFDFNANVATAFGAGGEDTLINGLVSSFWGEMATGPDQAASKGMLKTLLTDLQIGDEGGNAARNKGISAGICTAALASSGTTFL